MGFGLAWGTSFFFWCSLRRSEESEGLRSAIRKKKKRIQAYVSAEDGKRGAEVCATNEDGSTTKRSRRRRMISEPCKRA
jgi:hypothetical protein